MTLKSRNLPVAAVVAAAVEVVAVVTAVEAAAAAAAGSFAFAEVDPFAAGPFPFVVGGWVSFAELVLGNEDLLVAVVDSFAVAGPSQFVVGASVAASYVVAEP